MRRLNNIDTKQIFSTNWTDGEPDPTWEDTAHEVKLDIDRVIRHHHRTEMEMVLDKIAASLNGIERDLRDHMDRKHAVTAQETSE